MDFFEDCFEDFCELVKTGTPQNVQAAISGVDVNAESSLGMTALRCAATINPNSEVITVLLEAGADGKAKNDQGKTAFDEAQQNQNLKDTDAFRQLEEASL